MSSLPALRSPTRAQSHPRNSQSTPSAASARPDLILVPKAFQQATAQRSHRAARAQPRVRAEARRQIRIDRVPREDERRDERRDRGVPVPGAVRRRARFLRLDVARGRARGRHGARRRDARPFVRGRSRRARRHSAARDVERRRRRRRRPRARRRRRRAARGRVASARGTREGRIIIAITTMAFEINDDDGRATTRATAQTTRRRTRERPTVTTNERTRDCSRRRARTRRGRRRGRAGTRRRAGRTRRRKTTTRGEGKRTSAGKRAGGGAMAAWERRGGRSWTRRGRARRRGWRCAETCTCGAWRISCRRECDRW